jgi:D-glycero-D-manno-heptose 1,7-bisphosphate phosphatase
VTRRAVFIDRDGTIIQDFHFIGKPEKVELLSGAGEAIARLNRAGWPVIVVTNQSGIARGYFTEADYERVRARLDELLAPHHARVDASYHCPHHPEISGPCECRKPGPLLFVRAAHERSLETKGSWFIGDKLRDVLPAKELGGHGVLIPNEETPAEEVQRARKDFSVASSLDEVVKRIVKSDR